MKIISPANIALVKHWGMKTDALPYSSSLSFNLDNCYTTVEILSREKKEDDIVIVTDDGDRKNITNDSVGRDLVLWEHVQELKKTLGITTGLQIISQNSFPMKVGIASSASGFSAITSALVLFSTQKKLFADTTTMAHMIAQAGSISACRSIIDGACVLTSQNEQIAVKPVAIHPELKLVDIIAVIDTQPKKIGSEEGQLLSISSPHFQERIELADTQTVSMEKALEQGDWETVRAITIEQSKALHQVVETSVPPFRYIHDSARELLIALKENIDPLCYAVTFDAGTIPHIITTENYVKKIKEFLTTQSIVKKILVNLPGAGTRLVSE